MKVRRRCRAVAVGPGNASHGLTLVSTSTLGGEDGAVLSFQLSSLTLFYRGGGPRAVAAASHRDHETNAGGVSVMPIKCDV